MATVIAFDVYGTLVDPLAITTTLEPWCGAQSQLVATTWRHRQLEYTWRRSAMGRYVDFAVVTAQALQAALAEARCYVSSTDQQQICQLYTQLPATPHAIPAIQTLRNAGFRCCSLEQCVLLECRAHSSMPTTSPLTSTTSSACTKYAAINHTPTPTTSSHNTARPAAIIAGWCHPDSWDVLGAIHAGLHGIWVRPDGTPNETWEFAPDVSLPDFPTLVDYARINIR
jgi:2-haloacid dehalogenase